MAGIGKNIMYLVNNITVIHILGMEFKELMIRRCSIVDCSNNDPKV
jgi:hypothetical protein